MNSLINKREECTYRKAYPDTQIQQARQLEGGYHSELSNYVAVPFMSAGEEFIP